MKKSNWWDNYPWRMVQTNLREIDMDGIDAKSFAKDLADMNATVVTLNAAGILASYDTNLPYQNKSAFLTGDSLKDIIEECHRNGIKVIARCDFSKIGENIFKQHPDWAYRKADGTEVNYNGFVQTCVNSDYQQRYVFEILKELFEEHDFDGLFCNMSGFMVVDYDYNMHGPCHCDNCKRLFKEQFDAEIPQKEDPRDPAYGKYSKFKSMCTMKQKQQMYNVVKSINPGIAVNGFDYERVESNQDMDRPAWIYQASTNARKSSGPDKLKVCDSASTDFLGFQYRHTSVSSPLMELRQWQNLANAGSTSLYIMGTLANHKDKSGIKASKKAFDFFANNEEYYKGLKSSARVLLVDKMLLARVDAEVSGFIRALNECHIPFDEIKLDKVTPEILSSKDVVILADTRFVSDEVAAMFDEFVAKGGTLIATGESGCNGANFRPRETNAFKSLGLGRILEKKTGLKSSIFEICESDEPILVECTNSELGYIVPGNEVVVHEILDKKSTECYLIMVPDQLYGPPEVCYSKATSDIPGLIKTKYGEGYGVYVPWLAGSFFYNQGYENTFLFLKDLLVNVCGIKPISDVSPMCEITVLENDNHVMIQLVNTTGCFTNSFYEPVPLFGVRLDATEFVNRNIVNALALNGGNVSVDNGVVVLDCLNTYEAVVINK